MDSKFGKKKAPLSSSTKKIAVAVMLALGVATYYVFVGAAAAENNQLIFVDETLVNSGNPPSMDCSPMSPKVIVYNRIPKAGSTTLIALLKKMSIKNNFKILVPDPKHDPTVSRSAIMHALQREGRTVVVEHFNFPDILADDLAYINVLRHPVERCVSAYNYLRYGERTEEGKAKALRRYGNLTLDECFAKPWSMLDTCSNCPSQGAARFFCGPENGICDRPHPEEMLRRSWYNIESQYFVGLTEDMQATAEVLESLYPEFFSGMAEALGHQEPQNINPANDKRMTPETRKKMEIWMSVDMELYRRVTKKFYQLHKTCLARKDEK